jgi:hypothetical protein
VKAQGMKMNGKMKDRHAVMAGRPIDWKRLVIIFKITSKPSVSHYGQTPPS